MFITVLFTIAKTWKQPKCPSTEGWKRCVYTHTHTHTHTHTVDYYSSIKKNKIMPFAATEIDIEIIILSEISQISY